MNNPLESNGKNGIKRSGAGDARNVIRPLTKTSTTGGAGMATESQYTDSGSVFKDEQPHNWQRIGEVLAREIAPQIVENVRKRQAGDGE